MILQMPNLEDIAKYIDKVPQYSAERVRFCLEREGDKPFFCELPDDLGGKPNKFIVNFYSPTIISTVTVSPSPSPS